MAVLKETQKLKIKDPKDLLEPNESLDREKQIRQIKINIFVISVIWMISYTGFTGLQDIESSLNKKLGTYALGALAAGTSIMCIVSPAVIRYLGCKECFVVAWVCFSLFIGANFYPKDYILIPAAFITGIANGLTWTAQGIYLTTSAIQFSALTGTKLETVLSTFFGLFFMAYQSTQIWGNIISSAVLLYSEDENEYQNLNSTNMTTNHCGARNCPSSLHDHWRRMNRGPESIQRYILLGIFLTFVITGLVITVVFLKPIQLRVSNISLLDHLSSTIKLLFTDLQMLLLVPIFLYTGLQMTVILAEFTKVFVTCSIGIGWVGYTTLCYGISDTIMSPLAGILRRFLKHTMMITWAMILNLVMIVVMLLWKPSSSDKILFFLVPAVWGLSDAIWQTQTSALTGSIFQNNQEAGFANLRLFVSLGKTTGFLYSAVLCEDTKLYIAASLLVVAVVLSTVGEFRVKHGPQMEYDVIDGN